MAVPVGNSKAPNVADKPQRQDHSIHGPGYNVVR